MFVPIIASGGLVVGEWSFKGGVVLFGRIGINLPDVMNIKITRLMTVKTFFANELLQLTFKISLKVQDMKVSTHVITSPLQQSTKFLQACRPPKHILKTKINIFSSKVSQSSQKCAVQNRAENRTQKQRFARPHISKTAEKTEFPNSYTYEKKSSNKAISSTMLLIDFCTELR